MKNAITNFKRSSMAEKILFVFLGINFLVIIFINFFKGASDIGYDSSCIYLFAQEVRKNHTLILPQNMFVYQGTLFLDSTAPLAALFYGITGNIFISFALSGLIFLGIFIYLFAAIAKDFDLNKLSILVILNLLLSLFVASTEFYAENPLGYPECMLITPNFYLVKQVISLFVIKIFIDFEKGRIKKDVRSSIQLTLGVFLIFLAGVSDGYRQLVTLLSGILIYFLVKFFIKNDFKCIINLKFLYLIGLCSATVLGKWIQENVIHFHSLDDTMKLINTEQFFKNLSSIFLGYMHLFNAVPYNPSVKVFDLTGINLLINFLVFVLFNALAVKGVILLVKKIRAVQSNPIQSNPIQSNPYNQPMLLLPLCIILENILMYTLVNSHSGSPVFEERYLILPYIMILFFTGYAITNIQRTNYLRNFVLILMMAALSVSSLFSINYYRLMKPRYPSFVQDMEKFPNVKLVYGDENNKLVNNKAMIYCLRVLDQSRIYKLIIDYNRVDHFGDYFYLDDASEYQGETLFIASEEDFNNLPEYLKSHFSKTNVTFSIDCFYLSKDNPFDFNNGLPDNIGQTYINFPYTSGMVSEGDFTSEGLVTSAKTGGPVLYGPYAPVKKGQFNFKLNYQVINAPDNLTNLGLFRITTKSGENVVDSAEITKNNSTVEIKNVNFSDLNDTFETTVSTDKNVNILIKSVQITKVS